MAEYDWDEACDLLAELEKYCTLEEDSHGEAVRALCCLSQYPDYITQELWDAVVAGMKYELENYKTYATIVVTPTTQTYDVSELEWK